MESVSFVIATHGRPRALAETLAAIARVEHPRESLEVIVVADGPDQEAAAVASTAEVGVRFVAQEQQGAAAARNRGARMAEGGLLIFCDDDVIVAPDHVARHLAAREVDPDALVNGVSELAPGALEALRSTPFGRYRIELEERFEREADGEPIGEGRFATGFVSARNLAIRRETFWGLGGFDESYPYPGAEDQDLSIRARRAGRVLLRDHRIRVLHNEQILDLGQFCRREERGATTVAILARRFPGQGSQEAIYLENRPLGERASPGARARRLVKVGLSRRPLLWLLRAAADGLPLPGRLRRRAYRAVIGLHIFRGVRAAGPLSADA